MLLSLQGSRCQSGAPGEAPGLLHGPPSPTTPLPLKAEAGCGFPRSASPSILPTLSAGLWERLTGWPWPPLSDSAPTRPFPSRGHCEHSGLCSSQASPWMPPSVPIDALHIPTILLDLVQGPLLAQSRLGFSCLGPLTASGPV